MSTASPLHPKLQCVPVRACWGVVGAGVVVGWGLMGWEVGRSAWHMRARAVRIRSACGDNSSSTRSLPRRPRPPPTRPRCAPAKHAARHLPGLGASEDGAQCALNLRGHVPAQRGAAQYKPRAARQRSVHLGCRGGGRVGGWWGCCSSSTKEGRTTLVVHPTTQPPTSSSGATSRFSVSTPTPDLVTPREIACASAAVLP